MPFGMLVHDVSPIDDSEQNTCTPSDLYLISTPSGTGVRPSGWYTVPAIWLVGSSRIVKSSVVVGAGIVAARLTGSGLKTPAARTVISPGQMLLSEKAPLRLV